MAKDRRLTLVPGTLDVAQFPVLDSAAEAFEAQEATYAQTLKFLRLALHEVDSKLMQLAVRGDVFSNPHHYERQRLVGPRDHRESISCHFYAQFQVVHYQKGRQRRKLRPQSQILIDPEKQISIGVVCHEYYDGRPDRSEAYKAYLNRRKRNGSKGGRPLQSPGQARTNYRTVLSRAVPGLWQQFADLRDTRKAIIQTIAAEDDRYAALSQLHETAFMRLISREEADRIRCDRMEHFYD